MKQAYQKFNTSSTARPISSICVLLLTGSTYWPVMEEDSLVLPPPLTTPSVSLRMCEAQGSSE